MENLLDRSACTVAFTPPAEPSRGLTRDSETAPMADDRPRNRVRQARRNAGLSQQQLADRIGVHRSAVAQWEKAGGSHPTMENLAKVAIATSVSFEWLGTGRGRMRYTSDLQQEDSPVVMLEYAAHDETEARALVGLRRLEFSQVEAVIDLIEALGRAQAIKLKRKVAYSR